MKEILVIDNDTLILEFVADLLPKDQYVTVTAKDGLSALEILKTHTPDIIFVDVVMPNISGPKLCKIIKGMERLRNTYVVILSATVAEEAIDFTEIGVDACIAKGPLSEMAQNILFVIENPDIAASKCASGEIIGGKHNYAARAITEELLSVKKHFETILDAMSEGILEVAPSGEIIYANKKAVSLMGIPEEMLLGLSIKDIFNGSGIQEVDDYLNRIPENSAPDFHDSHITLNDHQISVNILPVINDGLSTSIIILTDVTDKLRMAEQLIQAKKMEALGTLAGGIAHNFNNLLMAIQGNVSLMRLEKGLGTRYYEKLKTVEEYVRSGSQLTHQLLGLAKGGHRDIKTINLNWLVKESSDIFGRTKKEIIIHRKLEDKIWPVEADESQIEQTLLNLYVNAWQAMKRGGDLYIETKNVTLKNNDAIPYGLKAGNYVQISIADNGSGMDKKTMGKIFDPFFTTKEIGVGTGLGLASVYSAVKDHNGAITVESEEGAGTRFDIYLPVSGEIPKVQQKSPEIIQKGRGTILFVEDEKWIIDVTREMLEEMGYVCITAESGNDALCIYKERASEIDVVILDMIMPGLGGGDTFDKLKEMDADVRVILSSGYGLDGEVSDILNRGCCDFIQKPFKMDTLSKKVKRQWEKNNGIQEKNIRGYF